MSRCVALWLVAVGWGALAGCLAGCGDDVATSDGGADASVDGGDAGLRVTPPNIPWLTEGVPPIMLAPCPEGWREVHGGAVTECDPYPEGGAEVCDLGEAHFPGEPGCRPIGAACPTGDYAASLPSSGPVVYVKAGVAAGGDGTVASPFAALSEVPWVSLAGGATVALGKGTYEGVLPLRAGVSVVGACVRDTVVTGLPLPVPTVVSVTGAAAPAMVQNLTIRGAPQQGVLIRRGCSLTLQGVFMDRVHGFGLVASGAGTTVSLTDVVIRDTEAKASAPSEFGIGLHLQDGARLDATRLVAVGNRGIGVSVTAEGSLMTLTDSVVRDTRPRDADGIAGRGINVEAGARVDVTRVLVSGNRLVGVISTGVGTAVSVTDVVIRDTESRARDGVGGGGLSANLGAEIVATRVLVAGNRGVGVFVSEPGTEVTLTDVVVRDTEPQTSFGEGGRGRGVQVQVGAHLEAIRVLISNNSEAGVFVGVGESVMAATDMLIRGTRATGGPGEFGRAAAVELGGRFEASRLLIADNRELGLFAAGDGTTVNLSDTVIRDTRSQLGDHRFGRGLEAQEGARVEGTRLTIDRSLEAGALALTGATMVLTDTSIHGVERADCASTSCPDANYGYAAAALSGSLSLTRFHLAEAAVCGVMVSVFEDSALDGSLDLASGVVSGSEIGACVQVDGYDFDRLTDDVHYRDNATNLDSTRLPVPNLAEAINL